MAAVTRPVDIAVRGAQPGEGRAVAALWRELWDAHEAWGGYPGSHDARVYDQLAARLEQDAIVRGGLQVLGRHVHVVAAVDGKIAGQVEGWFERHGVDPTTPPTCEVRSLIVRRDERVQGVGRALLGALASTVLGMARGTQVALAAEVLEPNPAHSFYAKVGYRPIAWATRIDAGAARPSATGYHARIGEPRDALPISTLEGTLAARRRAAGDVRFDRPRSVDATLVGVIAAHLANRSDAGSDSAELVVVDAAGAVRGAATFAVNTLEPPFLPLKRAMLGRFALDPARPAEPMMRPLLALACRMAAQRGARAIELTDLPNPSSEMYAATLSCGAKPWSRVVLRLAAPGNAR
jgi:GNAT superfamily N-acetyltransferase